MPAADRLGWYAQHFEMVEVNSTFYAAPDARMVERWCRSTPDHFTFNVKLHQLFSRHSTAAKLLPPSLQQSAETDSRGKIKLTEALEKAMAAEFIRSFEVFRAWDKLGALLLQLSPAFSPKKHELNELDHLLDLLAAFPLAIEFRNRNWAEGEQLHATLEFLRARSASLVSVDAPSQKHFTIMPPDLDEITNPAIGYLRLHGRNAQAYITGKTVATRFHYDYDDTEIDEVAERARRLATRAREVHVVFNNNALDYAPHAAWRLRAALKQIAKAPPREPELF